MTVKSADRKPQLYTDPNAGKRKIRMVPVDKNVVDEAMDDVSSYSDRRIYSILKNPNHPHHGIARSELIRRRMKKDGPDTRRENRAMKSFFELREAVKSADRKPETYTGPDGKPKVRMVPVDRDIVKEKILTAAEKKKREEIAKAIQRDNPDMPMDKKMAIATAQAKRVAEEKQVDEISKSALRSYHQSAAKSHHMARVTGDNKTMGKRHRGINTAVAKLSKSTDNSIERDGGKMKRPKVYASEDAKVDEARVVKGGYRDKDGKWHPPMTRDDLAKAAAAKRKEIHRKTAAAMREAKVDELSMSLKDLTKTGLNKAATKDKDKIKSDLAKLRARLNKKADGKPVNEISDKMKDRYVQRAVSDYGHSNAVRKDALSRGDKDLAVKMKARMNKRNQGMTRAFGGERD